MPLRALICCLPLVLLAACGNKEPPPRSVQQLLDNPFLLDAALSRCQRNRTETRYESECVNAREAAKIIEARDDARRREEFEALSEKKRRALRETQAAVAEARRRAAEAERQREEMAYEAQFVDSPSADGAPVPAPAADGTAAQSAVPASTEEQGMTVAPAAEAQPVPAQETAEEDEPSSDLDAIRRELQRRAEDTDPPG